MRNIRLIILMILCMASTNIGVAMASNDAMGFTYNGFNISNAETSFGIRDGTYFLLMRGAPNRDDMPGAGFFEVNPNPSVKAELARLRSNVCALKKIPSITPGNNAFLSPSVTCDDGREVVSSLDLAALGKDAEQFIGPPLEIIKSFFETGEKIAKLDALVDVKPQDGKLLVTVTFVNSGKLDIAFKSPSTWEGHYNPIAANSYVDVSGKQASYNHSKNPNEQLSIPWFGGNAMINRSDYPDDVVRIPSGQSRYASFLVYPDDRIKSGRYSVGAILAIRDVMAPSLLAGKLEFGSGFSTVEFSTDYPANQKDLGEFKAYRRTRLFRDIHGIGDAVQESGYYRAFGEKGERDDFPQRLLKGDKYPTRQMETQTRNGRTALGPAVLWRWEAYPDAQMTACSRERCPRSGMWLATVPSHGLSDYAASLFRSTQYAHKVEAGDPMPILGIGNWEQESQVVWTWLRPKTA